MGGEKVDSYIVVVLFCAFLSLGQSSEQVDDDFLHVLQGKTLGAVVVDEHVGTEVQHEHDGVAFAGEVETYPLVLRVLVAGRLQPVVPQPGYIAQILRHFAILHFLLHFVVQPRDGVRTVDDKLSEHVHELRCKFLLFLQGHSNAFVHPL